MLGSRFSSAPVRRVVLLAFCVFTVLAGAGRPVEAAQLRAGVAVADITSDTPPANIHDPLHAKTLIVDDGTTRAVIISLDITGVSATLVTKIRDRLQKELGIDQAGVLINATHNHHTQGQVAKDLVDRTVEALKRASQTMVPVRVGAGVGHEDRITMNRRLRLNTGKHWTIRRANPSPRDSSVVGLGPLDPEIGILRLDTTSGKPLAVVYNFAAHPYGGVPDGRITADLPGFASAVLEESLNCPALFLQGAAGDVTPVRYKDVHSPPPTEQLGGMLGLSTLSAVNRLRLSDSAVVKVISETIELPRRRDLEARIASLEDQQESILEFFTGIGCGAHGAGTFLDFKTFLPLYMQQAVAPDHPAYSSYLYMHEEETGRSDLRHLDEQNKQRVEKYLESIAQMERLIQLRSNLSILQRQQEKGDSGSIPVEVQGMRIGNFALITFPGEPFAEIGLRIKEAAPFEFTFLAGYSNGHLGYAPTAEAYATEAYEDTLTRFAPEWQGIYEAKALEVLRRLEGGGESE